MSYRDARVRRSAEVLARREFVGTGCLSLLSQAACASYSTKPSDTMPYTQLTEELNGLVADATVLYQKLRHYHWNVSGPHFFALHQQFEVLYTAWADAIDDLAERVRTLGGVPVHTLASVLHLATLEEDESVPGATEMVRRVAGDLERLHVRISDVLDEAEETSQGTADLLNNILDHVEKDLWMLGAWLHADDASQPLANAFQEVPAEA